MKIFLISNLYPSKNDRDYGVFVRNIEEELLKSGAEITERAVIQGRSNSSFDKIKKYQKFYFQIISAYRRNDFDLVYLHFISHSSPGLLIAKSLFGKKKKFVINVHGSDVLKYNKSVLRWCNNKLLKATDLLVVPSSYFKTVIHEVFPNFSDEKIFVSPSGGIDLSIFKHRGVPVGDIFHLGFVSRIEDNKGWKTLLIALLELKNRGVAFKLSIAGTGSKLEEMKSLIDEYNLGKQVTYLGILSQEELSGLYNNLDLFIFPTKFKESLGLVGLEAMACGVPVIGSKIGGLKTFIQDGKNGFFFTSRDESELTEKIQKFYKLNEYEKTKIREFAIVTARKYDRKRVVAELYGAMKKLVP